jgi:hypothetical protein
LGQAGRFARLSEAAPDGDRIVDMAGWPTRHRRVRLHTYSKEKRGPERAGGEPPARRESVVQIGGQGPPSANTSANTIEPSTTASNVILVFTDCPFDSISQNSPGDACFSQRVRNSYLLLRRTQER